MHFFPWWSVVLPADRQWVVEIESDDSSEPAFSPFFYGSRGPGIPGTEVESIGMDSNFVHKSRLDEANQLLLESEEDLYEAKENLVILQARLRDSGIALGRTQTELIQVQAELRETQELLAEMIVETFDFASQVTDLSDPNFLLLEQLVPSIKEKFLKKD